MSRGGIEGGVVPDGKSSDGAGCGVLLIAAAVVFLLTLLPMSLGPLLTPRAYSVLQVVLCEPTDLGGEMVVRTTRRGRGKTSYSSDFACRTRAGGVRRVEGLSPLVGAWVLSNGFLVVVGVLAIAGHRALTRVARAGVAPSKRAGESA